MKSYTQAEVDAFHGGELKNITLTFSDGTVLTNNEVVGETLKIDEGICEEAQITFGKVYATSCSVQVIGTHRLIDLDMTVEIECGGFTRCLGTYKIASDTRTSDYSGRVLTGYNKLKEVIGLDYSLWHNGIDTQLSGTITLKQYRDSFFDIIGITQQNVNLPNDDLEVDLPSLNSTLTGQQVLSLILEMNGVWGYLDFDGIFRYVFPDTPYSTLSIYPSDTLFPSIDQYLGEYDTTQGESEADYTFTEDDYTLGTLAYEEYTTEQFTKISCPYGTNQTYEYGVEGNTYTMSRNVFTQVMTEDQVSQMCASVLDSINKMLFVPGTFKTSVCPWIELGDMVAVETGSTEVVFPVLQRTISGIQAMADSLQGKSNRTNFVYETSERSRLDRVEDYADKIYDYTHNSITFSTTSQSNPDGTTTGRAYVYRWGEDVTNQFSDTWFSWYRVIESGTTYLGTGKEITVRDDTFVYGGVLKCVFQTYTSKALAVDRGFLILDNSLLVSAVGD